MNSGIANLLKTRVGSYAVTDRIAGLVRAIPYNSTANGKTTIKNIPLACEVTDPDSCSPAMKLDLVPDGSKRSIIYFEDLGWSRLSKAPPGANHYLSKVRMVVWLNTKKIGEECAIGDSVQSDLIGLIEVDRYNDDPYQQVYHKVVNAPPISNAIFSRYNYNEAERQFLTWPFSYFALDIETRFLVPIGCAIPVVPTPVAC